MMQIRCQHCQWMLTLSREAIALALAEAQAKDERYHTLNCPQCRHVIKLQVKALRQRLPADYPLPTVGQASPAEQTETDQPAAATAQTNEGG